MTASNPAPIFHGRNTRKKRKKPDGEEIGISKAAAKKGSSKDSKQPDDGEKFTVKYRDVTATIERQGNSIKVTIVEP